MARKDAFAPLGPGDWRSAREAVRSLYVARNFRPVWTEGLALNVAGRALLDRLNRAGEDALSLSGIELPKESSGASSWRQAARIDVTLSAAAVVYALEASGARIAPQSVSPLATPKVEVVDPARALIDLAVALNPGEVLQSFNPPQPGYQRLREKLADLLPGEPVPTSKALVPSAAQARFAAHGRLGRYAALPGSIVAASYESASNEPLRARLEANMEMWRWEPHDMGVNRVEINIPEYILRLYRGNEQADEIRVVVGKPDTPTPVFSNKIRYLLVNPIWRVPESIVRKEMLPKAGGDPSYLADHGYNVKWVGGQVFVEQPPGEGNALGRLLFMFPNEHSVYLHDTPLRSLFATARRAYSHGCIRVEEPLRLASEVMGGAERGWPDSRVESLYGSSERWVFLPAPLPIHIEYFTAFVDETGDLREAGDIYGLTTKVAAALSRLGQD